MREGCGLGPRRADQRGGAALIQNFDAKKKVNGIMRHVVVDTQGLLMHAIVHTAEIQDRDGRVLTLSTIFGLYPWLTKVFADGGYRGARFRNALKAVLPDLAIEIVKRSYTA